MKYNTKKDAEQAAKEFTWNKLCGGSKTIERVDFHNAIGIKALNHVGDSNTELFYFTPLPEIAKDAKVWVRNSELQKWKRRHATGDFTSNGMIECYEDGKTSFTTKFVSRWSEYSLTDPTK